ncbi:thioredoxin family protein [Massilibacteroides vaginae]|uniref:thioredoxin family protein n=1 Tax=Massilibacteroides vaginae TaxID=1673718 RepID=UPI000A1CAC71|nr:thioredoxin family protein [Massilibacteroides vaginae]
MEIIVLGTGCPNCKTTYNRIAKVIEGMTNKPTLRKEENILEIINYNIMSLPAVVVDGEVVIKGIVPTEEEIRRVIIK